MPQQLAITYIKNTVSAETLEQRAILDYCFPALHMDQQTDEWPYIAGKIRKVDIDSIILFYIGNCSSQLHKYN